MTSTLDLETRSGKTEIVVMVRAVPQVSQRHGETLCCAGIDLYGNWLRLYPVAFRTLEAGKKFGRWDRVRFTCRRPTDDHRTESRRVDHGSLEIAGKLRPRERERFLAAAIVTSLDRARAEGKSLALLRANITGFSAEQKSAREIVGQMAIFQALREQKYLANTMPVMPHKPCPYRFRYRYRTADGEREDPCEDWEIETAFYRCAKKYGEKKALAQIEKMYGADCLAKGMLLAMGTDARDPDTWLIHGIIQLDPVRQLALL